MRLRLGHTTLLRVEFQPPTLSPQSDLQRWVASRWDLPQTAGYILLLYIYYYLHYSYYNTTTYTTCGDI